MTTQYTDRLEDFITLSKAGKKVQVDISLRKEMVKQTGHATGTDDIIDERVVNLFMADFTPQGMSDEKRKVSKIYAFCDINETETDEKIIRHTANERLKMDYKRLRDGKVQFEEKYF